MFDFEDRPEVYGMGGNCFACAIALEKHCFPGATLVLAVNSYHWNNEGSIIGHCAVFHDGKYYDQEGEKPWWNIESWGMLDSDEMREKFNCPRTMADLIAYDVERIELSAQELLQLIPQENMKDFTKIMDRYNSVAKQKEQKCL